MLERRDQVANAEPGAPQVDERVDHELAGAVVGDLAATVDLHDRDVPRREQVFRRSIQAQRKNAFVLREPDLVRR